MKRYTQKSQIKILNLHPKSKNFNVEKTVQDVRELTKKAWGDPAHLAQKWLDLADYMVAVYSGEELVAFATAKALDKNALNFIATVIDPEFQGRGLSTKLNLHLIWEYLEAYPIELFKGFDVVFRTQNPSLYEIVYRKLELFPNYRKKSKPTVRQEEIFQEVVRAFCPDGKTDEENFVIKKAHEQYPNLIYKKNKIPWAQKSQGINRFFDEKLGLSSGRGDTMVLVGRINLWHLLRYDFNRIVKYYIRKVFSGKRS